MQCASSMTNSEICATNTSQFRIVVSLSAIKRDMEIAACTSRDLSLITCT
jgi:hypothetical protein